jgi:hypothetical protein
MVAGRPYGAERALRIAAEYGVDRGDRSSRCTQRRFR